MLQVNDNTPKTGPEVLEVATNVTNEATKRNSEFDVQPTVGRTGVL